MEAHRADVKFKEGCPSITCIDNPTILPKKNKGYPEFLVDKMPKM
jgi:hypothetical protein